MSYDNLFCKIYCENDELNCEKSVENEFNELMRSVQLYELTVLAKHWICKYDLWLNSISKRQALARGVPDAWEDVKHDLIIKALEAVPRYDVGRGVPLATFLMSTLWTHSQDKRLHRQYKSCAQLYIALNALDTCSTDSVAANTLEDKSEVSSLEQSHKVYLQLKHLREHEQLILSLRFDSGMQLKDIDEMFGVSRGTTHHRIKAIILKLQTLRPEYFDNVDSGS